MMNDETTERFFHGSPVLLAVADILLTWAETAECTRQDKSHSLGIGRRDVNGLCGQNRCCHTRVRRARKGTDDGRKQRDLPSLRLELSLQPAGASCVQAGRRTRSMGKSSQHQTKKIGSRSQQIRSNVTWIKYLAWDLDTTHGRAPQTA